MTEQRRLESRLRTVSEVDELTGLPNRRHFNEVLRREIVGPRSNRGPMLALMLGDLDHFKAVNDTLGHSSGDRLLRVVAERLQDAVGAEGFVARLGGDEFAILLAVERDEEALGLGQRVIDAVAASIDLGGRPVMTSMSLGCAVFPRHASDASELMRCADTALHDLKAAGRGGVRIFDADMLADARHRADELERARRAITAGLVGVHLQPRVRLPEGQVVGFEVLLRWRDPDGVLHGPETIAEAFQDFTLATQLAEQVREALFREMRSRIDTGERLLPVALNAAAVEFMHADFAPRLLGQLERHGVPPALGQVEIAERALTHRGAQLVQEALRALKGAGAGVSIDDFGSGSASFAHLRRYSVDSLKIDRDLVHRMTTDPGAMAIVRAVVGLGQSLALDVVAEGVETPEQRVALVAAGCSYAEGFLFGRPGPMAEVLRGARRA